MRGFRVLPPTTPPPSVGEEVGLGSTILETALEKREPSISAAWAQVSSGGGATVRTLENREIGRHQDGWHVFLELLSIIFKYNFM